MFPLMGEIRNWGSLGVRVIVEGSKKQIESFVNGIRDAIPPMAYLESVEVEWEPYSGEFPDLQIAPSVTSTGRTIVLPPDLATCDACLGEMFDPALPRYYRYPFIACVECGPRFTTMESLPYDRERSTMHDFPFCPQCQGEYSNPEDRRFHAQTFACRTCGPRYAVYANAGGRLEQQDVEDIPQAMAGLLLEGNILAVKGIGGVHLVCRADLDDVVLKLRERKKKRKYKPFAIMARDVDHVRTFADLPDPAVALLTSFRRPIVLLPKNDPFPLAAEVAPGLDTVGVILPYMGLHHLLFDENLPPLVFTSGNVSNLPMAVENDTIVRHLGSLADYFILHDRRIAQRCDDSVAKVVGGTPKLIRRSRGYVPEYIPLPFPCDALQAIAFGPELHSTGAFLKLSRVFPTQHIGNVTNLETLDFLGEALTHMLRLLGTEKSEVRVVTCDLHPGFHSSRLAQEWANEIGAELVPVQHHHAHHAALLGDNSVPADEPAVTIAVDGVGHGSDGAPWGGEIFVGTYAAVERQGHLQPLPMPGGDLAAKFPARMLLGALSLASTISEFNESSFPLPLSSMLPQGEPELQLVVQQLERQTQMPLTTSLGRVLDALATGFGLCTERTYDGEPAMRFEAFAAGAPAGDSLPAFQIPLVQENSQLVIATPALFAWLMEEGAFIAPLKKRQSYARACHIALAGALATAAQEVARGAGVARIGLTGGVALNTLIAPEIQRIVEANGFHFLEHVRVPPGDAGVSFGQCAVVAANQMQKK